MRLRGIRKSTNIVDKRGRSGGARAGGLGGIGLLIVLAIGYFAGVDVTPLLQGGQPQVQQSSGPVSAAEQEAGDFAAQVLTTTEAVWDSVFPEQVGRAYVPPKLVLFSGQTQSACGGASAQSGPFYCPADKYAYLDTSFFATMAQQLGATGDFAAAYVIAHEVAHHVQNSLGILSEANRVRAQVSQAESNAISVRIELQADCFSGIWARAVGDLLEPGDLDEALNAAKRIGDDYLAQRAGRAINPHTFTHGTSAQRQRWFATGYQTGDMRACDTFGTDEL